MYSVYMCMCICAVHVPLLICYAHNFPRIQTSVEVREGGCVEEEEGRVASGSESGELAVNRQSDVDHISFSYSSDEDFLPHHMKQGGDMKPCKTEKPYHKAGVEQGKRKPYNSSDVREAIRDSDLEKSPQSRSSSPDPLPSLPELDRERRKMDHLSLAQRRRRLCSITPRGPLALPTAAVATPTASTLTTPTTTTGHSESSRQPISPGLHYSATLSHKHSHSKSDGGLHTKSHCSVPHSVAPHRPPASVTCSNNNHPLAEEGKEGEEGGEGGSVSGSMSDSDDWSPGVQRRKKSKKKKTKKDEQRAVRERELCKGCAGVGEGQVGSKGRRRDAEGTESRERRKEKVKKKKKSSQTQAVQQLKSSKSLSAWPEAQSHDESDSSDQGLSRVKDMVKKKLKEMSHTKHEATEELKDKLPDERRGTGWLKEDSSDDEMVLEELKRKVKEEEMAENAKETSCDVIKLASGSLEEELAVSTSSDSEPEATPPEQRGRASNDTRPSNDAVGKERQLPGPVEEGEEEVAGWGKARPKRQILSSDSESDGHGNGSGKKRGEEDTVNGTNRGCVQKTAQRPAEVMKPSRGERSLVRDDSRKRGPDSSTASPAKQLRLIDIDFTGGRMKQLPPPRPPARHSPARPRSHASTGHGPDRKLKSVQANATNILKSSKPVKLVSNLFHSSKSSWSPPPCKKSSQEKRREPTMHKDAVLAAKFPQKRKLLDSPPIPIRAHKNSKLNSHRLS